jgi:galactokinase
VLLDCRALSHRAVALADGLRVVIADTRALRQLAGSEYGERRAACEEGARLLGVPALRDLDAATFAAHEAELPPLVARRCRFVIEENARVLAMAEALPAGDRAAIGGLCAESFQGACELYEIGAPAMSAMHAALLSAPGVIGARQAGAGFGGCLVALVEADACEACATSAEAAYAAATGLTPSIFAVDAAAGAGVVAP